MSFPRSDDDNQQLYLYIYPYIYINVYPTYLQTKAKNFRKYVVGETLVN